MDVALLASILAIAIRAGTSLVYASIGEIYTERSGVLNLGVEGMMLMGAVSGFAVAYHTNNAWLGVAGAMIIGAVLALIHAFLTVSLRANQVVSGLALTIFATGLASFLGQKLGPNGQPLVGLIGPRFKRIPIPVLSDLPVVGDAIFNQDLLVYGMFIFVIVSTFYLYRTRAGLNLRAVGENPRTSDSLGVGVYKVRYIYTIVGGMLVALGGAHLSLSYTPGWTENLTGGRGWIAIALVIFAVWSPPRALVGALLFGGINAIQFRLQAAGTTIPSAFLAMLPYIFTIVVLVIITWYEGLRNRAGGPAALGSPYVREEKK